jgi:hypothetical protein
MSDPPSVGEDEERGCLSPPQERSSKVAVRYRKNRIRGIINSSPWLYVVRVEEKVYY